MKPKKYEEKLAFFKENISQDVFKQMLENKLLKEKRHTHNNKENLEEANNIYDTLSNFWKTSEIEPEIKYLKNKIVQKYNEYEFNKLLPFFKIPKNLSGTEIQLYKSALRYALQEFEIMDLMRLFSGGMNICGFRYQYEPMFYTSTDTKDTFKLGKNYDIRVFLGTTRQNNGIGNMLFYNDKPLKEVFEKNTMQAYWTNSEPIIFTKSGKYTYTIALKTPLWKNDVPNYKDTTLFFTKEIMVLDK